MRFAVGVVALVFLYGIFGLGAAWLQKRLHLISVAHAAIVGTGAYVYASLAGDGGNTVSALAVASAGGCVLGAVLTLASERTVGDDFALLSFAAQSAWFGIVSNARHLTRGALGIAGVQPLPNFGLEGAAGSLLWAGCAVLAVSSVVISERGTLFGPAAEIVARSQELAGTLGLSTISIRAQAGGFYGAVLAFGGGVFAGMVAFVGPDMFRIPMSVGILAMGFLGCRALWLVGPGALLIIGAPELLRLIGLSASKGAFVRMILGGLILAGSAAWLSRVGERD